MLQNAYDRSRKFRIPVSIFFSKLFKRWLLEFHILLPKNKTCAYISGLYLLNLVQRFLADVESSRSSRSFGFEAGRISISKEQLPRSISVLQKKIATMNPVAIAEFFHTVCDAIFKTLIQPDDTESGIFGDVSTYFGVVDS
jgi:hypothetical protein